MANHNDTAGFTLIELLVTVAIIGVVTAMGMPALLRAKVSGNEASAIASVRAVETGQRAFSFTCGEGAYADSLAGLATPPPAGGQGFISEDIGLDPARKSGYLVTLMPGNPVPAAVVCNGTTVSDTYAVVADPEVPGLHRQPVLLQQRRQQHLAGRGAVPCRLCRPARPGHAHPVTRVI